MGKIDKLPRIFKDPRGNIQIVYRDRVEYYQKGKTYSKGDIDRENGPDVHYEYENIYGKGWNAQHEVQMLKDNGFREIHPRGGNERPEYND